MIAIGNDHVAYDMKLEIIEYFKSKGLEYLDCGANTKDQVDYTDFGYAVAKLVSQGKCDRGVLICGSGVGISISANKVNGIRCVVCSEPYSAKLSRQHNNTNILAIGSRVVGIGLAKMILDEWLEAEYEGGRHQKRIDKIIEIEKDQQKLQMGSI